MTTEAVTLSWRRATTQDADLLGQMNRLLIEDENHHNTMTVMQLQRRMRSWLATDYVGVIFEREGRFAAYVVYIENSVQVYIRHFFVSREFRRMGVGSQAIRILLDQVLPSNKRLLVDALSANVPAVEFWRSVGFSDYAITLEIPAKARK